MATIAASSVGGSGAKAITETTLTGTADTFTYVSGGKQYLILRNDTGGALTPNIVGDGVTTISVEGAGAVDLSGGYDTGSIAAGDAVIIKTSTIEKYLTGTIDITGGTGLVAQLLEY